MTRLLSTLIDEHTRSRMDMKGRELPCHVVDVSGQIVTVQFDMLPEGI
ncbi:phage baseplate protein, partial [Escherichia coli]|nr:phage baseplate protein [Escherichia coli]